LTRKRKDNFFKNLCAIAASWFNEPAMFSSEIKSVHFTGISDTTMASEELLAERPVIY
jgi:hypothetical protein